ncbi:hypothetical protein [Butyrivibrio sp. INlla16]|uniref:hypothetical protein n=1 Tax=Butyrivibrio sp. INlla16 TaxID=1520807 RepID=UPI00088445A6|nr:hypothetical protein [Butyrivibrio sp. INlla16]SDB63092.1 hypothetical protein SAMN02910263_03455 [Butyrivibrio sp. INlla16]
MNNNFGGQIQRYYLQNIIWLFIFSFLLSFCFFSKINPFVDSFFSKTTVKLTLKEKNEDHLGNEIWIYQIDGKDISKPTFKKMEKSGEWEYRSAEKWGYSHNVIYSNASGSSLKIPISTSPSGGLGIICQRNSGRFDLELEEGIISEYDPYTEKSSILQITPFADNYNGVFFHAITYLGFAILIFVFLSLSVIICNKFVCSENKEPHYKYPHLVFALTISMTVFLCIWWKTIGIPNYPGTGDGGGYWTVGQVLARPDITKEEVELLCKDLPTFRGYGIFIPHFIANYISYRTSISAIGIYFVIMAFVCAFGTGYVLPRMYEIVNGRKPGLFQVFTGIICFYFLFTNYLCDMGSDMCGCVYYLAAILFLFLMQETGRYLYAALSGMFFSLCLAARTSYMIGVMIILIFFFVHSLLVLCKNSRLSILKDGILSIKRWVSAIVVMGFFFFVFCLPQVCINNIKGHPGLFAYDTDGAFETKTTTLLEQNADIPLRGYVSGYPEIIYDKSTAYIKQYAGYKKSKEITMAQSMDCYSKRPLDGLASVAKKLFILVDIKTNITLPNEIWTPTTKYYLFSTINYIFLVTTIFMLLNKKVRRIFFSKEDLTLWGIILFGPILPELVGKIEWRQGMILYVFYVFWAFAYGFGSLIYDKERRILLIEENYIGFLTVGVFICHTISLWMYIR